MIVGKSYTMHCADCGYSDTHYLRVEESHWNYCCPRCGGIYEVARVGGRGTVGFQPFVTEDITGEPVEITGPKQRDRVLQKHGLTMDNYGKDELSRRRSRHLKESSTANVVTLDDVMTKIKKDRGDWR